MREQGTGNSNHETGVPHPSSAWVGTGSRKLLGPLIILLAAALAIAPQLIRGNSCGHDFDVHLVSWLDCVNAWKHGIPYPHWTPSPNYGAGEPRFVFYPPLTWMLGALLGLIFGWTFAPIAMTFFTFAGTGLATRALALQVFEFEVFQFDALDDLPATLAGCFAMFSGFTLFTGYERSAFPEFAGGVWLPLLLLFALRDRNPTGLLSRRAPLASQIFDGSTAPLALMLAGTWLSNLPLAVIATYLLAGVALLAAAVRRTWAPVLRAAVAAPLGLGLAALYWFPAAMERNWVDIHQATQDPGYNFENNWLFVHNANPTLALHDAINRQASWIAVSMIALALVALAICWRRGTLPINQNPRRWWIPLAAIPVVVLFFSFPLSRPLWVLLPEMRFLQYPWRLLEAVEAPMAIFVVAAIWPATRRARIVVLSVCAAWFVASTFFAGTYFFQACYPEDTVASTLADYRDGAGFEGLYEYEPPNGDLSIIPTGIPDACLVTDPNIVLGKPDPTDPDMNPAWTPAQNTCPATFAWENGARNNPEHRKIFATMPHAGYLVLHLLRFPAWAVRVNGGLDSTWPPRDDGLIVARVPSGPVLLTVDWTTSLGDLAGRYICVLSIFLLIALSRCERRLARSRLT
jgi:hypothetical protein